MSLKVHRLLVSFAFVALVLAPAAAADDWLPHPKDATWTYEWTDSVYNTTATKEKVTVKEQAGPAFTLEWTTVGQENPPDAPVSIGLIAFQETPVGLVNTDWSSTRPPSNFPILCATPSGCNNSLASTYFNVIWGSRAPVLAAPLLKGAEWTTTGGAQGDVSSTSDYVGVESVKVPAFENPVLAAKIRSEIVQAGALGDPYGSGVRTVWWVYGVGPVKVVFEHSGSDSAVLTSVLASTNQTAKPPPPDTRWFPMVKGATAKYRWTNTKHMKKPSVQQVTVDEVVNGSARYSVKHLSGPIRVAGAYGFTLRNDGVTNLWGTTKSATLSPFPKLGPANVPQARRRTFATPYDLLTYGFGPLLPAYPTAGMSWSAKVPSRDFSIYGVRGTATVVGTKSIHVPAGTFKALVVKSTLLQKGFPFGSGTRTVYYAADRGLVKLVFEHADRSVSTIELMK